MSYFSNSTPIKRLHVGIAEELFKWIEAHRQDQKPMTYGQLAKPFGMNPQNLRVYLGDLSTECHTLGLPLISAIVVSVDTNTPGGGFYEMAASLGYSKEDIEDAQDKVFAQTNWELLRDKLGL